MKQKKPEITKIVITGGPCAGKSTAMSRIQDEFSKLGYTVIFIPETATELITGGVAPWTCGTNAEYQKCQMTLQIQKEKIFCQGCSTMKVDKILLVCDRGALDNRAYMNDEEFAEVLKYVGADEVTLRDSYDGVFHLVTAAKGAKEFYTTANNSARIESVETAIELDDKIISAWTGHPHFRVIDNSTDFEVKIARLLSEITSFLGLPAPYEIERKFLIEYPDIEFLEKNPACKRVEIIQTYLKSRGDEEIRIRQRGDGDNYTYFITTKREVSDTKRIEIEKRLSQREYLTRLMEADTSMHQIRKTRYCLTYKTQYFEIDIYPFWSDKAVVEVELNGENDEIVFPPEFKIIEEVTGKKEYSNAGLAGRKF